MFVPLCRSWGLICNCKIWESMKYRTPDIQIFEVAVDKGYGDSVLLPGFGTENDELVY